ncbi:4'-phosphopantetheinyl transferase superfamily protein [Paraburkholderia sp. Tr-20389]|uniref:4'-phosphopantetheinyl transferase family protein n=1 Tax=Paraburkholderia sp. Tr-20389 TaxID=2703903 RepID=UPI00197E6385|nr:4'-phosphopantetheinyl transferase superfamily protein [Paraburkholderia sp. Tr-20389]MBN3758343.1 4'-phosphopantetheinyl transferase superfamily protein [Paraburkholderia sp. Tr-20389]
MTACPMGDVWMAELADAGWDAFDDTLAPAETQRYRRMHDPQRRAWHLRARIAARMVLARYLHVDPHSLRIVTGFAGKPRLADDPLQFNVSHSDARALIAVSRGPVGVDLEHIDARVNVDALLDHVCHETERNAFTQLTGQARVARFFALWVAKEAYCKALGEGLRKPMTAFSLAEMDCATPIRVFDPAHTDAPYWIQRVVMPTGWTAALCSQSLHAGSRRTTPRSVAPADFIQRGITCRD